MPYICVHCGVVPADEVVGDRHAPERYVVVNDVGHDVPVDCGPVVKRDDWSIGGKLVPVDLGRIEREP